MIHYHGGPITPDTCAMKAWKGRHAFISFAHSGQINLAAEYCQSFALDNGAFTAWKATGKNKIDWSDYYEFVARWKNHPGFDFAIIPDVSTNVARNIGIDKAWKGSYAPASKETRAALMVERIESHNSPGSLNYCAEKDKFNMQLQLAV